MHFKFLSLKTVLMFGIMVLTSFQLQSFGQGNNLKKQSKQTKTYNERVQLVRNMPGLAAFWDFVLREDGVNGKGNFMAYTAKGDDHRYILEPRNISRAFWNDGAEANLDDFPLFGYGPFGQAVQFKSPKSVTELPVLMLPRANLNNTPIDVKGPGQSVSMVVWMIYQDGAHAIAGLWHEGTDSPPRGIPAELKVRGQRQYGMFAGLSANPGSVSAHVSENGLSSFGDHYARQLATTKEKITKAPANVTIDALNACWSVVGFVYDNKKKTVTAYLDGKTTEYWIENPVNHPFYKHAANAWKQARLSKIVGLQDGENDQFPKDQYYCPPESKLLSEKVISESNSERIVIREFEFTKVRLTLQKDSKGKFSNIASFELVAIKANPYWFGKDIYSPQNESDGSPFTIGRVIHSNRHATLSAYFGGVAVFNKGLSQNEMLKLSKIGRNSKYPVFKLSENQK
jgi:hypothetical protein